MSLVAAAHYFYMHEYCDWDSTLKSESSTQEESSTLEWVLVTVVQKQTGVSQLSSGEVYKKQCKKNINPNDGRIHYLIPFQLLY